MTRPLATSPHARARWAVLAPHPDDETIGVGALIAEATPTGRLAAVAYLTDGSGSHPAGAALTRARLVRHRRREARLALHRLGVSRPATHLGWQDAHPPVLGSSEHARTVRRLAALLRTHRVDALAVTASDETHRDHVAAHALARAAIVAARRPVALFAYRVWGGAMPRRRRPPLMTAAMPAGLRRHALAAHRSQTGAALGPGFRVPKALRRMPSRDLLHIQVRSA